MNGDAPRYITSWTGVQLKVYNELTCFDYGDVDNELEGDSGLGVTGRICNATPNGFTLYAPKFYMNSVQGSDRNWSECFSFHQIFARIHPFQRSLFKFQWHARGWFYFEIWRSARLEFESLGTLSFCKRLGGWRYLCWKLQKTAWRTRRSMGRNVTTKCF